MIEKLKRQRRRVIQTKEQQEQTDSYHSVETHNLIPINMFTIPQDLRGFKHNMNLLIECNITSRLSTTRVLFTPFS